MNISLKIVPATFVLFKLKSLNDLSPPAYKSSPCIVSQGDSEVSVLCEEKYLPANCTSKSSGWKLLKFSGMLDDNLVGTVSTITLPLANAGISVIVNTTYDSGYFGVKTGSLDRAIAALEKAGINVTDD